MHLVEQTERLDSPIADVAAGALKRVDAADVDIGEVHLVRSTGSALPDLEQAVAVEEPEEADAGDSG